MATKTVPVGAHVQDGSISAATTFAKPAGANAAWVSCSGQNVRITLDGITDPTATLGFLLVANAAPILVEPAASIRAIEVAASANINLQWVFAEDELMHHP